MNYLERSVGNKKILWLKQYNRYLVLELSAYDVIKRKLEGQDRKIISAHISKSYHLPESEAKRYVGEIVTMIKQLSDYNIGDRGNSLNPSSVDIPNHFYSTKCYKINELKVIPLPQNDRIRLVGHITLPAVALVYDMTGRLITEKVLTATDLNDIPLVNAANGVYMLKIDSKKTPVTKKVVWIKN